MSPKPPASCTCRQRGRVKVKDLHRKYEGRRANTYIASSDGKLYGSDEGKLRQSFPELFEILREFSMTADGRTVFHLHEPGEQLESLLRYCYTLRMPSADRSEVHHLLSIYRLTAKYNLQRLKHLALASICETYPATIDEWQCFFGERDPSYAPEILQIVKKEGLTRHMRAVYYSLCQLNRKRISGSQLSERTKQQVRSGKCHLSRRLVRFFENEIINSESFKTCQKRNLHCQCKLKQIVSTATKMASSTQHKRDPLYSLFMVQFGEQDDEDSSCSLCGLCLIRVQELLGKTTNNLWDELPVLFHFQST